MGSPENLNPKAPLIIRGHHLYAFAELLKTSKSPSEFSREAVEDLAVTRIFREGIPTDKLDRKYIEEVLGKTVQEREHFEEFQKAAFEMFVDMPDDFPVEIVTTVDDICRGCALVIHCLESQGDEGDIYQFTRILKPGQRKTIQASPDFPLKITTTLGVVRLVLEDPVWNLPRRPVIS